MWQGNRCFSGGSDSKESACTPGDPGSNLGQEDPLEEGMATHSSTLAWRIPWAEEPGGLSPGGSQRVGQTGRRAHFDMMCDPPLIKH